MSWGALNNQRERKTSDPLPDFLTDQPKGVENSANKTTISNSFADSDLRRSERAYVPKTDINRGYGVSYAPAASFQMTKKNIVFTMFAFAFTILATFFAGYLAGSMPIDAPVSKTLENTLPAKRPIIPFSKKKKHKEPVISKVQTDQESAATATEPAEKELEPISSHEHNNKEQTDSEAIREQNTPLPVEED